ncbi:MAG: V-type ATP synthase subunit D [Desulfatibacillaceae bacterium]|nr:V-type ATP synthase subunit D [Desulfatibacillaceae bacterium]
MPYAKVKLTVSELKRQKNLLARFERYLPTLTLKKFQLQSEYNRAQRELARADEGLEGLLQEAKAWAGVLNEWPQIAGLVKVRKISTSAANVAGVNIPIFESVDFEKTLYDFYQAPPWVEAALEKIKALAAGSIRRNIAQKRAALIYEELRTTLQRVNLFEKIMIPRTRSNIRQIQIYLADQQAAAVVRGKIAKTKIRAKSQMREASPL